MHSENDIYIDIYMYTDLVQFKVLSNPSPKPMFNPASHKFSSV